MTSKIIYNGNLRTTATHLQSGTNLETDAPVDNNGKGERFSPTDLVATALGSCMLTFMGIAANTHSINIDGTNIDITKHMGTNPRRIVKIDAIITFIGQETYTDKQKAILENSAKHCAVLESLHPDLEKNIVFNY